MATFTKHRFMVTSRPRTYNFPIDMLRYDACWPESQSDVAAVEDPGGRVGDDKRTRVTLVSHRAPSPERWASFGWNVTYQETVR